VRKKDKEERKKERKEEKGSRPSVAPLPNIHLFLSIY
jgi:hypothetical protein